MNNSTYLTDDELSVIMVALQMALTSYDKYVAENGKDSLDIATLNGIKEMTDLYNRLNKEFF